MSTVRMTGGQLKEARRKVGKPKAKAAGEHVPWTSQLPPASSLHWLHMLLYTAFRGHNGVYSIVFILT